MNTDNANTIAVFGSSSAKPGQAQYEQAVQVGATLAELGYDVVTGGYGGLMEAVSRGAAGKGRRIIGVTCRIWSRKPNTHLTEAIDTGDIFERLQRLIEIGQGGCVVLSGGTGTLLELAAIWELMCKKMAPRRPIVCLGQWWRPALAMVEPVQPEAVELIKFIDSPAELAKHFPAYPFR